MTGDQLRRLREAAGIKQYTLAVAKGMSAGALSVCESNLGDVDDALGEELLALLDTLHDARNAEYRRLREELLSCTTGRTGR